MNLKTSLLVAGMALLCACSSAQKTQEDDLNRPVKKDPAIEQQAQENARLYNQTPERMYKTRKLPSINYDFDSIRPPEYAYDLLDKIATVMTEHPNIHLIVEGHADLIGSDEYNYWISGARAAAMKSYLVSRGVMADRIRVHAYGKDRPITLDNSSEGRRANRRVEFTFTTRKWESVY